MDTKKSFHHSLLNEKEIMDNFNITNDLVNSGCLLLHFGKIIRGYSPSDSQMSTEQDEVLHSGDVAVVYSDESIEMDCDKMGIVFGSNSLTCKGLLVINPGVITAGHSGPIGLTVVNFGKERKQLNSKEVIGRLIVFKFTEKQSAPGKTMDKLKHIEDNLPRNLARTIGTAAFDQVRPEIEKAKNTIVHQVLLGGVAVLILGSMLAGAMAIIGNYYSGEIEGRLVKTEIIVDNFVKGANNPLVEKIARLEKVLVNQRTKILELQKQTIQKSPLGQNAK